MPASRPWTDIELPAACLGVPAQLSAEERRYLTWLTHHAYRGEGRIVELGTLLGGSSTALAEGLRRRGDRDTRILAIDSFSWYSDEFRPPGVADGDDFRPHYEAHVEPYVDQLEIQRMDLTWARYDGGPIELLFVDAGKTWSLFVEILRCFGPHLIPGRSRVVLQDFRFFGCYYQQLILDRHRELWDEIEDVAQGWTVTLAPKDQSTLDWCAALDLQEADIPWPEAQALLSARIARSAPAAADCHRLAGVVLALLELTPDAVRHLSDELLADGPERPPPERRARELDRALDFGIGLLEQRVQAALLQQQHATVGALIRALREKAPRYGAAAAQHLLPFCDAVEERVGHP